MHPYLVGIQEIFSQHANVEKSISAKAYMLHQFEFFGIVTANRRKLSKEYMNIYYRLKLILESTFYWQTKI